MRTLVVGDIHGGYRALQQVMERVDVTAQDRFIFVGDYVDGWSESSEVIEYVMALSEKNECILLRGNHEELLYNFLKHQDNNPVWLAHGGESSKKSYAKLSDPESSQFSAAAKEKLAQHILFLENLQNYYIDKKNRLFVHAGFTNQHGPEHEYYSNTVYWDRTLWEMACGLDSDLSENDEKYPKRFNLFKEIFIGHTPVTRIGSTKPVCIANVWNVDTGAAFKGRLSVLDVDSKQLWQSDPVWQLYPDEQGRN